MDPGDDRGPDPSLLTTQQLQREILALEKLLGQRIDAIEKAVVVAHENIVRVPTDVDKAIGHLRDLSDTKMKTVDERFNVHLEKFDSVQTQFSERDVRTEQTAKDSKVAVDAALQAAKEAVGKQQEASDRAIAKSESAMTKQLDQLVLLIGTNKETLDGKINDVKNSLALIQGTGSGKAASWAILATAVSMLAALIGVAVLLTK